MQPFSFKKLWPFILANQKSYKNIKYLFFFHNIICILFIYLLTKVKQKSYENRKYLIFIISHAIYLFIDKCRAKKPMTIKNILFS